LGFPASLAAGDLNGDGKQDLVVTRDVNSGNPLLSGVPGGVSVLWGDGHGGFTGQTDLAPSGANLADATIADLNGDGKPDIVVADAGGSGTVSTWLGDGHGSFPYQGSFVASMGKMSSLAVADFDGDGHPDVATTDANASVSVALGDGRGGFSTTERGSSGGRPFAVAAADFVGDGRPDLAIVNSWAIVDAGHSQYYDKSTPADLAISYTLTPPLWWPSWAAGAWPSVLAQWASAQWPSSLHPWDINAWVPQPAINTWSSLTGGFGFSADAASRHARRTTPAWLRRLGARRIPAWLTPRTVSRWAAAAEHRAAHRHRAAHHV
jgi:hypothetical protein